jgi:hypothetical protein
MSRSYTSSSPSAIMACSGTVCFFYLSLSIRYNCGELELVEKQSVLEADGVVIGKCARERMFTNWTRSHRTLF